MQPESRTRQLIPHVSTFSIVAFDPGDPAWGIAVASKFPAVGAVVPWAIARVGAVATQAHANTAFGPKGLDLMTAGASAQSAMDQLLGADPDRAIRQLGMVDSKGNSASFTGEECLHWAGGLTGEGFAVQGNILTGPETIEAMASAFTKASGDLPDRLLDSLLAGDRAGGDRRGRQSAAIFVVKPEGGYSGYNDRWMDYRVDDHQDPVPRLGELVQLHRLYFYKSPPEEELPISGEIAQDLQMILKQQGYYQGEIHGQYDQATRVALDAFIGTENFEDRTDIEIGRIDRPVFEFLKHKFPV